jgi:hypothetical protein
MRPICSTCGVYMDYANGSFSCPRLCGRVVNVRGYF